MEFGESDEAGGRTCSLSIIPPRVTRRSESRCGLGGSFSVESGRICEEERDQRGSGGVACVWRHFLQGIILQHVVGEGEAIEVKEEVSSAVE